jgi:hypothetical protein
MFHWRKLFVYRRFADSDTRGEMSNCAVILQHTNIAKDIEPAQN